MQVCRELKCGVSRPKGVSVSHPLLSSDQIIKESLTGRREKNARVKAKVTYRETASSRPSRAATYMNSE